ncbi:MAG: ribosome silencing factor [Thermoanaerobacterales bacterium]|nr:ribosome silencing factor [Bacillota bacterium]MDI6906679.1 ribosome silencing factor [Thermoanaerobacterales bacterium]
MAVGPEAVLKAAVRAARDRKGFDIVVLDIARLTVISDYFVLVSGRSTTHVQALAEHIQETLERETGVRALRREGYREGRWVLLDYGDVIVHIFVEEERAFYNLERLWGDATPVELPATL